MLSVSFRPRWKQREGNNTQEIACPLLSGVRFSPPDKCFIHTGRSFSGQKWTMKRDRVIFGNQVQVFTYFEWNMSSACLCRFFCFACFIVLYFIIHKVTAHLSLTSTLPVNKICNVLVRSLFCSPSLHWFDPYSKNSTILKYFYFLK